MIFSTDLIEDPSTKVEVELESVDDSNTFLESALEYITERKIKQKKRDIKEKKKAIADTMSDILSNPNKYLADYFNKFCKKVDYDGLYLPFTEKIKEINQSCYDKIVKQVKTDKRTGDYDKIIEHENDIRWCDTVVYDKDYIENYSNIRQDHNSASIKTDLTKTFVYINEIMKKVESANSPNDIETLKKSIKEHLEGIDENYNLIRGRVTGQYSVKDEKYAKALYKYFRDGQGQPTIAYIPPEGKGNISSDILSKAYKEYMDIQGDLKYNIEILSRKMMRDVEYCIKILSGTRVHVNEQFFTISLLKEIVKIFSEPQKILDIYLLFYSAKIDALYERFERNRGVLLAALDALNNKKEDN